jgi:L-malate glycosyltransferase
LSQLEERGAVETATPRSPVVFVNRLVVRLITALFIGALRLLARASRRRLVPASGATVLLTGTFYTDAWITTHLRPLAAAAACAKVIMVASRPLPHMLKVEAAYPPRWLRALAGASGSRTVYFVFLALRLRPDVVGGFHILLNGLLAAVLAPIIGARSLYFCGGGQREIEGGGYRTENRLYRRLAYPDPLVERWLIDAARRFDIIVTMGSSGRDYFLAMHPRGRVVIVPGGFDDQLFAPAVDRQVRYDLVLVGRLSPVKRVDLLLRTMASLRDRGLALQAVVVGDGPSRPDLERVTAALGLSKNVSFVGFRDDVNVWLQASRVFILTSESEGLSQAMIQGMLCGLPVVVTNVGDLRDLVDHGRSGLLIDEPHEQRLLAELESLFGKPELIPAMGLAARAKARSLSVDSVSRRWSEYLAGRFA